MHVDAGQLITPANAAETTRAPSPPRCTACGARHEAPDTKHPKAHVIIALALAMLLTVSPGALWAQQARCDPEEGTAISTRFGLQLCAGPASTKVITHEEPQRGARVAAADPEGLAARAGLVASDIIYHVGEQRVESGKAAAAALEAARDERIVLINFWRNGAPFIVRIWTK